MTTSPVGPRNDAVALAEKVVALLGEGQFTATYKYAVLLGLMDLCLAALAIRDMPTLRSGTSAFVSRYRPLVPRQNR
jgi:hypothetical protein